eukprot:6500075-Alexandrium_andersonii.AAC.1
MGTRSRTRKRALERLHVQGHQLQLLDDRLRRRARYHGAALHAPRGEALAATRCPPPPGCWRRASESS